MQVFEGLMWANYLVVWFFRSLMVCVENIWVSTDQLHTKLQGWVPNEAVIVFCSRRDNVIERIGDIG